MNLETVAIESLELDPNNARKHSKRNLDAIAASLNKFGQRKPIVVHNGTVIAGNGTLEAAKSLGWTEIGITRCPDDWDADTAKAYALADNRSSELAEWDEIELSTQLIDLDDMGWSLDDLGFTDFKKLNIHPEVVNDPFGLLVDKPRADATQMTFTLTLDQAEIVKQVIAAAKQSDRVIKNGDNLNSNGNALFLIVSEWSA